MTPCNTKKTLGKLILHRYIRNVNNNNKKHTPERFQQKQTKRLLSERPL